MCGSTSGFHTLHTKRENVGKVLREARSSEVGLTLVSVESTNGLMRIGASKSGPRNGAHPKERKSFVLGAEGATT